MAARPGGVMEIEMALSLPRDELSIPVVRHICRHALTEFGVVDDCIGDIEIALSEACTNVLVHSGPGDDYQVKVNVDDERCIIRVVDLGHGFDADSLADMGDNLNAESGRGIGLMRALVDRVHFMSRPEAGMIVHLEKDLAFRPDALAHRLRRGDDRADPTG